MRYKRRKSKRKSQIVLILEEHISRNKREYIITLLVFFIGIIIGTLLANNLAEEEKKNICGYINEFVNSIKGGEYCIDSQKLFFKSIISNLKIALIIWAAGSSIIGIPLVYASVGYKGLCIGYSISAIIGTLSKAKGIAISLSSMLSQNIIAIPCILALAVSSMKMYHAIIKNENKSYNHIKSEAYRHTIFSILMSIGLIISSIVEVFVSANVTSNIIVNFI